MLFLNKIRCYQVFISILFLNSSIAWSSSLVLTPTYVQLGTVKGEVVGDYTQSIVETPNSILMSVDHLQTQGNKVDQITVKNATLRNVESGLVRITIERDSVNNGSFAALLDFFVLNGERQLAVIASQVGSDILLRLVEPSETFDVKMLGPIKVLSTKGYVGNFELLVDLQADFER